MAKKVKYYCVWSGKQPGVYANWEDCEKQVKGVEGAKYKSFATREEAESALQGSPLEYFSPGVRKVVAEKNILLLPENQRPQYPALAVDGACSGNPGQMEYRGVDAATGSEIFHFGPVQGGTNNIAEYLAIVHALALLQKRAADDPANANYYLTLRIYSDSRTAQAWVRDRRCKTKIEVNDANRSLFDVITRADNWLATHTYRNPITKWDTDNWGEIPADFGRK